jgi:hypothetical protein
LLSRASLFSSSLVVERIPHPLRQDRRLKASDNASETFPPFLPPYHEHALEIDGKKLAVTEHTEKDNASRYVYTSEDQVVGLTIESIKCDKANCAAVYDQGFKFFDTRTTQYGGRFRTINRTEFRTDWQTALEEASTYVFVLPKSLLFWSYTARLHRNTDIDGYLNDLRTLVNRERYEEALPDNVEMGRWGSQIHEYARSLLKQGKTADALSVFKNLLTTSPFNYEAHLDFAENTAAARQRRTAQLSYMRTPKAPN